MLGQDRQLLQQRVRFPQQLRGVSGSRCRSTALRPARIYPPPSPSNSAAPPQAETPPVGPLRRPGGDRLLSQVSLQNGGCAVATFFGDYADKSDVAETRGQARGRDRNLPGGGGGERAEEEGETGKEERRVLD